MYAIAQEGGEGLMSANPGLRDCYALDQQLQFYLQNRK